MLSAIGSRLSAVGQERGDVMSCDVKPLVVRLSMYWLHATVIRRDRSRGKMIPNGHDVNAYSYG